MNIFSNALKPQATICPVNRLTDFLRFTEKKVAVSVNVKYFFTQCRDDACSNLLLCFDWIYHSCHFINMSNEITFLISGTKNVSFIR